MMFRDNFSTEEKYKLFRNMYEVIHPTISKKNISSYRIVLDENILPVRVFYPKKLANINSVIIFIPGEGRISNCYGEYDNIFREMAIKCDKLVIALDYFDEAIDDETLAGVWSLEDFYREVVKLNFSYLDGAESFEAFKKEVLE